MNESSMNQKPLQRRLIAALALLLAPAIWIVFVLVGSLPGLWLLIMTEWDILWGRK